MMAHNGRAATSAHCSGILAPNALGRECRQAHCDVLAGLQRRVADALSGGGQDRLARADVGVPRVVFDPKRALQDDGVFVERRRLERLVPSRPVRACERC
jgi:hypothetical protein